MQGVKEDDDDNNGKILMYDMRSAPGEGGPRAVELTIEADSDFKLVRPHGMSIWSSGMHASFAYKYTVYIIRSRSRSY